MPLAGDAAVVVEDTVVEDPPVIPAYGMIQQPLSHNDRIKLFQLTLFLTEFEQDILKYCPQSTNIEHVIHLHMICNFNFDA
ncbi:glyco protein hormone beta-5 [Trichinella spiralis]|uniref:glyco protein hormone beta-5 n=1 Tax=Trichinella spiralis TaxID=6334 RepID=UPI0001EFB56D|nr:glyco protein hormone beta-5 [Trichinella spiralis]